MQDILNAHRVKSALALVRPSIELMLRPHNLGIIIAVTAVESILPHTGNLETDYYAIEHMGVPIEDEEKARRHAISKTQVVLRSRSATSYIPPHYLRSGDTLKSPGVLMEGLIIGVSGHKGPRDRMYSYVVGGGIVAVCMEAHLKLVESKNDFVP
jgi:hypothetical protein